VKYEIFSGEAACSPSDRNPRKLQKDRRRIVRVCATFSLMLAVVWGTAAVAEPRTIDDCEKIQAADAYNQCLASFGPAAHEHAHSADPEGAGPGSSSRMNAAAADPETSRAHVSHYRYHYHYQRHATRQTRGYSWTNMHHAGRHRAEFSIK
jgi:hypothetical protein